jgi:hypothetical protein
MAYKGRFIPKNPKKYKGLLIEPTSGKSAIIWRSTWELRVMNYLDTQPAILEWSSEEMSIPYISPIDDRLHRYYPDFYVKKKMANGKIIKQLVEVKPYKQTMPPKMQKRITPKYITEVKTWGVNEAKWKAAERFCEEHGMEFVRLTEKDLGMQVQ